MCRHSFVFSLLLQKLYITNSIETNPKEFSAHPGYVSLFAIKFTDIKRNHSLLLIVHS